MTVVLICKPSTAQWLAHKYGNPVRLSRSNFKNRFLSCLEKNFTPWNNRERKQFTSSIEIALNPNQISRHGVAISPALQYHINDVIEEDMQIEAFEFIEAFRLNGKTVDDAIKLYRGARGFSDDIYPLNTIRMNYWRRKSKYRNIYLTSVTKKTAHVC